MKCWKYLTIFLVRTFIYFFITCQAASTPCSRAGSRLVRKVLEKDFYPVFERYGVKISEDCPLNRSRDLYYIQEQHKLHVHNAKWNCEACGKSFYRQEYIDLHMENKHQDLLVKEESFPVCLADYCQLFRCEAIDIQKRNQHFWSKALCNVENMAKIRKKCLSLVESCMAVEKPTSTYKQAYVEIVEETCLLINCKDYWQPLHYELSLFEVLYYLTFTPMFIFLLGIYYFKIWEYYCGDEFPERVESQTGRELTSERAIPGLRKRSTPARFQY